MLLLTLGEGHQLNIFILRGRPKDPPKAGIREDQGNATLGSPFNKLNKRFSLQR